VELTPTSGRRLSETVSLRPDEQSYSEKPPAGGGGGGGPAAASEHAGGGGDDGQSSVVAFSVSVDSPRRGPCILALAAGQFETCTMPENVDQLWGPVFLPSLPDGVPNTCVVASHRCDPQLHTCTRTPHSTLARWNRADHYIYGRPM